MEIKEILDLVWEIEYFKDQKTKLRNADNKTIGQQLSNLLYLSTYIVIDKEYAEQDLLKACLIFKENYVFDSNFDQWSFIRSILILGVRVSRRNSNDLHVELRNKIIDALKSSTPMNQKVMLRNIRNGGNLENNKRKYNLAMEEENYNSDVAYRLSSINTLICIKELSDLVDDPYPIDEEETELHEHIAYIQEKIDTFGIEKLPPYR